MPVQLRTTTLAAAATNMGIRVYTTSSNGDIREGCLNLDIDTIAKAAKRRHKDIVDQADGWFPGELRRACAPGSTLCAFAWASWSQSLFYQTSDNCIRQAKHTLDWYNTSYVEADALPGTDMAEVHAPEARCVIFFWQNKEGFLCCRRAVNFWDWGPVEHICKAALGTGIAATTWNGINDVHVYYQNESNALCERGAKFDGPWSSEAFVSGAQRPLGTLAAVSYFRGDVQIRLYVQEENEIVEWCKTGSGPSNWSRGSFTVPALPSTDIAAVIRNLPNGVLINVLWAGPDQILHQRVMAPRLSWLDSTPIGYLTTSGTLIGCWNGTHFTDNDSNIDRKVIKKIKIGCSDVINGFGLEFTDGTSTPWRGGRNGNSCEFVLYEGEDIVQIVVSAVQSKQRTVTTKDPISGIKFITSIGRSSPFYGTQKDISQVWSFQGHALAGFAGAFDNVLNGLLPMWGERVTQVGPNSQEGLIRVAEGLGKVIQLSLGHCQNHEASAADLERSISIGLRTPSNTAIQSVNVLVHSVEGLHALEAGKANTSSLIAGCKHQSVVVEKQFTDLHETSKAFMKKSSSLVLDITHEVVNVEAQILRVKELLAIADTLRVCTVEMYLLRLGLVDEAQKHSKKAHETKEAAERLQETNKIARVVRDVFTLGLGEIDDWLNINEAIDYADKLISSAENNLQAAESSLTEATAEVQNINNQLQKYALLKTTLDDYNPKLNEQVSRMGELREKTSQLTNLLFDISIFLGTLAAKTETLKFNCTSEQFAQKIIALAQLIGTTVTLGGIERLGSMQKTLELIASSAVGVDNHDNTL